MRIERPKLKKSQNWKMNIQKRQNSYVIIGKDDGKLNFQGKYQWWQSVSGLGGQGHEPQTQQWVNWSSANSVRVQIQTRWRANLGSVILQAVDYSSDKAQTIGRGRVWRVFIEDARTNAEKRPPMTKLNAIFRCRRRFGRYNLWNGCNDFHSFSGDDSF